MLVPGYSLKYFSDPKVMFGLRMNDSQMDANTGASLVCPLQWIMQAKERKFARRTQQGRATKATIRVFQKLGTRRSNKTMARKFMIGTAG
jgi:hypothetical protein